MTSNELISAVAFNDQGLVPAIAQDATTGQVLMMAWMDRDALAETVASGQAVYYSRSRKKLWRKGESSGHVQQIRDIRLDCDGDTILLSVEQKGGIACHTGREHCFYRQVQDGAAWRVVDDVLKDPITIYGPSS